MSQFFASSGQKMLFRKESLISLIKAVFNAVAVLNTVGQKVGVDWGEGNSSEANSNSSKLLKLENVASLVAQWSRICLPVQRTSRDSDAIPGLGRSLGRGRDKPLQYSYLENPMSRGTWWAMVHRVKKSWASLKQFSMHAWLFYFKFFEEPPYYFP